MSVNYQTSVVRRKIPARRNTLRTVLLLLTGWLIALPAMAAWEPPALGHTLNAVPTPVAAPEFTLMDMDDIRHSFSDYKGKVVLLNFWATWCPPCRREMPSMDRLYQKLKDHDFTVIAINQMEEMDHVFAYTGQLEVDPTFTILFDMDSKVAEAFHVNGLPTTYLIDKQGRIRYRAVGGREFDHPEVEQLIQQLLKEP